MSYECETWTIRKTEEKKIDSFQTKFLRTILKVRWKQHISNLTVLEKAETANISGEIWRRRWNWIGQILRKDPADDCAVALGWRPEGRRKRDAERQRGDGWWR